MVTEEEHDKEQQQEGLVYNRDDVQEAVEPGFIHDPDLERQDVEEDREKEGSDVGEFEPPVIGRPRRERRVPGWHEQYEMGEDY